MTETRVARLLPRIREVRRTGACLILAIGTSFATVAYAGQGVWTSGGPYGGNVRALAIDPLTPSTLYAGMYDGGVFKSVDSGATWAPAITGLTNQNVLALAINPSTPTTLYAGTRGDGVFKSTDAGGSWTSASGLTSQDVRAIAINPLTPSTLYAQTVFSGTVFGGIFKSTDFGTTWAAVDRGLEGTALAIDPLTPSTLYAGTSFGVSKSTDSGATWIHAEKGPFRGVNALAINPSTPSILYAGMDGGVIYKSTDSGESWTWTFIKTEPPNQAIRALAIDPSTPSTLYAGTDFGGIFKSTDSGVTWVAGNAGNSSEDIYAIAINAASPSTLYAGTRTGVFRSTDSGSKWAAASTGLQYLDVNALAINPSTPTTLFAGTAKLGVISATGGGVFKSTDSGQTWLPMSKGLTMGLTPDVAALAIDPYNPATVYAGTDRGGFKSTDSAATWAAMRDLSRQVFSLAVNPSVPATIFAGTDSGVYRSFDSGSTWAPAGPNGQYVRALTVDPSIPSTLFAGTAFGGVFRSTDSGDTWASIGLRSQYVQALAIIPSNPSTLYVGTDSGGIFKSTDSGETWVAANTGLPNVDVSALAVNPASVAMAYAGTWGGGIFRTTRSGGTWAAINEGLQGPPYGFIHTLALDPTGETALYAGIERGGVWQSTPPAGEPTHSSGFVPIVLDVTGLAHYTSELQVTNLGAAPTTMSLSYVSSMGSGSGEVQEAIPAGQQVVLPDSISYLRTKGVPIPASGNQGGTLLLYAPASGIHATVRTSADTVSPQPVGRAGLAYTDSDPAAAYSAKKLYVYGLRMNEADRSNLAVYNMGATPLSLKVTLVSGDDGRAFEVTAGVPRVLPAYGWYQYNEILNAAGISSGYAIVERLGGSGPFGTYGVVNNQKTNDGSFIPALSVALSGTNLTIPVIVETGTFESELILANRGEGNAVFYLHYTESLSPAVVPEIWAAVAVNAGGQLIVPQIIDFLRSKGVRIGPRGEAPYAGSLQILVTGVGLQSVFAGARTSSPSSAGGEFGVFYPAIGSSQEFSDLAYILGLKADANNRSNVAALHTGTEGSGPITLELQVLDGSEGGKAVGQPLSVTLQPGQWVQPPGFFASGGVPNGYVRIRRTAGTAPWYAYGVINDGGQPGQRTGDGSYVPGVRP